MIALLFIALAWWFGGLLFDRWLGPPAAFLQSTGAAQRPWPAIAITSRLFRLAASLWLGLLPVGWLVYLLAWLTDNLRDHLAPDLTTLHPLLPANLVVLTALLILWIRFGPAVRIRSVIKPVDGPRQPDWAGRETRRDRIRRIWRSAGIQGGFSWHRVKAGWHRAWSDRQTRLVILSTTGFSLFAIWLMIYSFHIEQNSLAAGYSIFSDFAPHTALVSSFAQGQNWPTQYPHFAGDGIAYHFMFFFLCGNLNYLGLNIAWAINLPSILGFITFCILIGNLAIALTGRLATWLFTPLLLIGRSSAAIFTYIGDLIGRYGPNPSRWWPVLLAQSSFIGRTPHDDWGLWGINVYANQRHLLPGLSVMLIVILLFLPDVRAAEGWNLKKLMAWPGWKPGGPRHWGRLAAALLLFVLLPYWHGSALIAGLLILAGLALASSNRLAYVILAAGSVVSALLQATWLSPGHAVTHFVFQFGFIAEDKSPAGILLYLLEMMGLALPLVLLAFWLPGRLRKVFMLSAALPFLFAFTVSMTPDVTVNHKYIMITILLGNIWIADLLLMLWQKISPSSSQVAVLSGLVPPVRQVTAAASGQSLPVRLAAAPASGQSPPVRSTRLKWSAISLGLRRMAVIFMTIVLTLTGCMELLIYHNINRNLYRISLNSDLVAWIETATAPDAVFVTAPYHYNSFYLSGRLTWYGHSYYAWSAGHDTAGRLLQEKWFLAGGDLDAPALAAFAAAHHLDYLLIDDTLRNHEEFDVNEGFFTEHFTRVASFPAEGHAVVFDLSRPVG